MDTDKTYATAFYEDGVLRLAIEEPSDWQCHLSGRPGQSGLVFRPAKGAEPNAFWRLMQFLVLGFRWHRVSRQPAITSRQNIDLRGKQWTPSKTSA